MLLFLRKKNTNIQNTAVFIATYPSLLYHHNLTQFLTLLASKKGHFFHNIKQVILANRRHDYEKPLLTNADFPLVNTKDNVSSLAINKYWHLDKHSSLLLSYSLGYPSSTFIWRYLNNWIQNVPIRQSLSSLQLKVNRVLQSFYSSLFSIDYIWLKHDKL